MDDRRADWKQGVDENLASLNAGQRVWERDINGIRKLLGEVDSLLRGDAEKDTDGLMARLHNVENAIQMFHAVIDKDKAGNKGLVGRVEDLERAENRSERRLKVWIAVIGALSVGLSNLDKIEAFFQKKEPIRAISKTKKQPRRQIAPRPAARELQAPDDQGGDALP